MFQLESTNSDRDPLHVSGITRRAVIADDQEFLLELYGTTRSDILNSNLEEQHKQLLVEMQFRAQHEHYQVHFPNANFHIISQNEKPVGRIYSNVSEEEVRLIDITLLPEARNQGIGEGLIREFQHRATKLNIPLRLRVEPNNPAVRLYVRLGFQCIADEETNLHMEWTSEKNFDSRSNQ